MSDGCICVLRAAFVCRHPAFACRQAACANRASAWRCRPVACACQKAANAWSDAVRSCRKAAFTVGNDANPRQGIKTVPRCESRRARFSFFQRYDAVGVAEAASHSERRPELAEGRSLANRPPFRSASSRPTSSRGYSKFTTCTYAFDELSFLVPSVTSVMMWRRSAGKSVAITVRRFHSTVGA
jgi:hypothetical protein